jgi:RNA-binding protein
MDGADVPGDSEAMSPLTGKQRRAVRAAGQRLAATLHVGHDGVTAAVVREADAQLAAHEVIKVRVSENAPRDRHETADELAEQAKAELAQVLGRTILLYRKRPEESP